MAAVQNNVTLSTLPDHLIEIVFSYLSLRDCASLARTCREFHAIARSAHVFQNFTYTFDADHEYDPSVPRRCRVRALDITGHSDRIAEALSKFAGLAVGTNSLISRLTLRAPALSKRPACFTAALYKAVRDHAASLTHLTIVGFRLLPIGDHGPFRQLQPLRSLETLHLRDCGSVGVTRHIRSFNRLTELVFDGCELDGDVAQLCYAPHLRRFAVCRIGGTGGIALPPEFQRWRHITTLDLHACGLRALPDDFGALGGTLRSLDIGGNTSLTALPASFSNLTGLTSLNLSRLSAIVNNADAAAVGSIAWVCDHLPALEVLDVSNCALRQVPDAIASLHRLKCLHARENQLAAVPTVLSHMASLTVLDLTSSVLEKSAFPSGACSMRLRELYIEDCHVNALPSTISDMRRLTVLHVSRNMIPFLPSGIRYMTWLRELRVSDTRLDRFPEAVCALHSLVVLSISSCNRCNSTPMELPLALGDLTCLEVLEANNNGIVGLPASVSRLRNLHTLSLSGNRLRMLPTGVAGLTRLRHVDLSGNHFAEIPPPLLALPKLVTLNIGSCYHPEASCAFSRPPLAVPESLAAMTRLESLSLRNSNLRALPSTMVFPPRLAVLDLSWNRLQKLPESLLTAGSLRKIVLHGNYLPHGLVSRLRALPDLQVLSS